MGSHGRLRALVLLLVLMLVATVVLTTGCVKKAEVKPVIVVQGVDATSLDPAKIGDMTSNNLIIQLYDRLVIRDDQMKTVPSLAESYKLVDDTTWEFKLKKGVKFHNGEELTADAVKFSIERVINPATKSPQLTTLKPIKEVQVVDPYTVHIVTNGACPTLPARLTTAGGNIVPPKYFNEVGEAAFARQPVGSGPYKFVEWVKDDHITLEANPSYWKGKATIPQLIFKPVPEAATRVALLKTGEADIVTNLSPAIAQQLAQEKGLKAKKVPSMLIIYFALDETKPGPLQNRLVRQAMNYAVDKKGIIESILLGCGKLEANPISPETFGYNSSIQPYPYDATKARQLLTEAGYPDGFTVDMVAPIGRYVKDKEVAEAVAAQLGQVGIKVNLQALEYGVYTGIIRDPAKRPPMWMLGWGGYGTYHGDLTLFPLFRTGELYSTSNNAEFDSLIDKAIVTLDNATHIQLLQQTQQIAHDEALRLYLHQQVSIYGVSDRLDWNPRSDEDIVLWQTKVKSQ